MPVGDNASDRNDSNENNKNGQYLFINFLIRLDSNDTTNEIYENGGYESGVSYNT